MAQNLQCSTVHACFVLKIMSAKLENLTGGHAAKKIDCTHADFYAKQANNPAYC